MWLSQRRSHDHGDGQYVCTRGGLTSDCRARVACAEVFILYSCIPSGVKEDLITRLLEGYERQVSRGALFGVVLPRYI